MKQFSLFASSLIFFYLVGAFVMASFNISDWTMPERAFIAAIGTALSALAASSLSFMED